MLLCVRLQQSPGCLGLGPPVFGCEDAVRLAGEKDGATEAAVNQLGPGICVKQNFSLMFNPRCPESVYTRHSVSYTD